MPDPDIGREPLVRLIPSRQTRSARSVIRTLAAVVTITAVFSSCKKSAPPASTEKPAPAAPAAAKTAGAVPEPVKKVVGRWMRTDGGYVLELRGADLSGVLDAAYFNPKPIHVSRAIWMQGANGFQVMIELNDVGYPGATYVLSHDAQTDRLVGQYTQPAMQQSFDIEFIRQPKP